MFRNSDHDRRRPADIFVVTQDRRSHSQRNFPRFSRFHLVEVHQDLAHFLCCQSLIENGSLLGRRVSPNSITIRTSR